MGLVSSIFGSEKGSSSAAARQGVDILRQAFNDSQANLAPYRTASAGSLPGLELSATPEGMFRFAEQYRDLLPGLLGPSIAEAERDTQSYLGSEGLRRSGFGVKAIADANVQPELQFLTNLIAMMAGRENALAGVSSSTTSALGQFGKSTAFNIADTLGQGVLGDAQTSAQNKQLLFDTFTKGTELFGTEENIQKFKDFWNKF